MIDLINHYIAKQFKNPSGIGGKLVSAIMNRQNRIMYEGTIRLLAPSGGDSVLDIGCGNGYVLNKIAHRYNNCTLTGIDTSASIIRAAAKRNRGSIKSGAITLACEGASAMSFANESFHKAYTINTVYFWDSLGDTMAEIWRVMKPQGIFINTLYSNEALSRFSHTQFGYKKFSVRQITDAGENAGFNVELTPILSGSAYCILYRKPKGGC